MPDRTSSSSERAPRAAPTQKRRGRPPGSVSLTDDVHRTIVAYVRAGAFLHVAATAAGISPRTLYDWLSRGEGAPGARPSTPKLRAFAKDVRTAQAEARIGAEVRVYQEQPAQWLKYAARTKGELEGWSEPEPDPTPIGGTLEDRLRELDERHRYEARQRVGERLGCGGACFCDDHRLEVDHEYEKSQRRRG